MSGAAEFEGFLTGSHVYGSPGEDSDVDLVVLVRPEDARRLAVELTPDAVVGRDDDPESYLDDGSGFSMKFGKLNLILITDPAILSAWRRGTEMLAARRPVSRDEAKRVLRERCGQPPIPPTGFPLEGGRP